MRTKEPPSATLKKLNELAAFNRWCRVEVVYAEPGQVEMTFPCKTELGQYSGFQRAGVIATSIGTACVYAAGTLTGTGLLATPLFVESRRLLTSALRTAKTLQTRPRIAAGP